MKNPSKEHYASIGLNTDEEIKMYQEAIEEMSQLKAEQKDLRRRLEKLLADNFLDSQPENSNVSCLN